MANTYTTIQGDMWDSIAYKVYGRETGMTALLEANQQYRHIAVFPAGVTLVVPEDTTPDTSLLPPWRTP